MPLRPLRRFLRGTDLPNPFSRVRSAYPHAKLLVRIYYFVTLYLFAEKYMERLGRWALLDATDLPLLWPMSWAVWTGLGTAMFTIGTLLILGTVLSSIWPEKRPFRLLAFVGLLLVIAMENSFGKINHNMHGWLAVSFCFLFLPAENGQKRVHRFTYLTSFWTAQAVLLWFYTMSGVWKMNIGITQLLAGEINAFHPYAMAQQVANRLLQDNSNSLIGPFIVENPLLGWPLYLSALYLEFFAFFAAFRPGLHHFWGASLALFHLGTYLTMTITFNENILLLGLLLIASPFHPPNWRWQTAVRDLPIIGWIYGKL